jgi:hypothetical protein
MILICMGHKVVTWNNNNASAPFLSADVIYSCTAAFFLLALILGKQQVEEFTSKEIQIPPRAYAWVSPVFEANFHSFGGI